MREDLIARTLLRGKLWGRRLVFNRIQRFGWGQRCIFLEAIFPFSGEFVDSFLRFFDAQDVPPRFE